MHTILKQKKNPWPFIALSVKMHMIFPSRRHEINEFQAIHRFIIVLHTIRNKLTVVSTGITIKSKGITLTNTGLVRHYEILMCGAATSDNRELWVVYVYLYGFYYKLRWRCPASLRIEEKKNYDSIRCLALFRNIQISLWILSWNWSCIDKHTDYLFQLYIECMRMIFDKFRRTSLLFPYIFHLPSTLSDTVVYFFFFFFCQWQYRSSPLERSWWCNMQVVGYFAAYENGADSVRELCGVAWCDI